MGFSKSKFYAIIGFLFLGIILGTALTACGAATPPPHDKGVPLSVVVSATSSSVKINQLAPDFSWQVADQPPTTLAGLQGRPVVLNWWASWCQPCREEFPLLTSTAQDKAKQVQGLAVLGINLKETEAEIAAFTTRNPPGFPILRDQNALLSANYLVRGLPQTVFINREGKVAAIVRGQLTAQILTDNLNLIL